MKLIQDYNPQWKKDFEALHDIYSDQLSTLNIQIEHVGSTSVIGLAAKAIIDIDIIYYDKEAFENIKQKLDAIGYFHNGDQGIPFREAFIRKKGQTHKILDKIIHHLYVCPHDSPELARHLLFRDHLRSSTEACRTYERKKREIAAKVSQNKKEYAALKQTEVNPFIEEMIERERQNRNTSSK